MSLVYLDTSVWIAKLWSKDKQHHKTISIFNNVQNGVYTVIITHHILNEIAYVLRKKIIMDQKRSQDKSNIKFKTLYISKLTQLTTTIFRTPNVRIQNPNVSSNRIFEPSFNVVKRNPGNINIKNKCPICKINYDFWEYDSPDERDIIHGLLAVELNCDILITFDNDFRQLQNDPEFSSLAILIQ